MLQKFLFVDAETNGLYGEFITVAMIVTNKDGEELDRFYEGIRIESKESYLPWVRENVLPYLGEYHIRETEEELLKSVWEFWLKYKDSVYVIADIPYPVEARLFTRCVEQNREKREFQGPFPLMDFSSMLFIKGIDPLVERDSLLIGKREGKIHNALSDVKTMIQLWKVLGEK